jgi:hypothetical protein
VLIGLASTAQTGCTIPVDGDSASKGAEAVATTTAAELPSQVLPNVNCQTTGWHVVKALSMSAAGLPPVYQGSVSTVLAGLCTGVTSANPNCDPAIYQFTQTYYSDIEGAAGYFYVVHNFYSRDDARYWMAIPIIDSQVDRPAPVGYDPSYPGLPSVRFPYYSPGYGFALAMSMGQAGTWPESNGVPEGTWVSGPLVTGIVASLPAPYPFRLRASDYTELANIMVSTPANDSQVAAQDQTCVLIVDENGAPLDFAAHISQWDPKPGCAGCLK